MRLTGLWWWIDRWRKSTAYIDMTLEEQGAYRNLLDEAALRGGAIPADEDVLAKACGDPRRWSRVRAAVIARFERRDDGYHNTTLDEVLAESRKRSEKQRKYRNGSGNGGGNHGGNDNGNGEGNNQRPPDPDQVALAGRSPRELSRARGAGARDGVGAGTFPGDHLDHLACGPVCFTPRMTAKFIGRFGRDRDRLQGWARTVCDREQQRVDAGAAVTCGDDFDYWTIAYDADFGGKPARSTGRGPSHTPAAADKYADVGVRDSDV